jgi:hypothetical protein
LYFFQLRFATKNCSIVSTQSQPGVRLKVEIGDPRQLRQVADGKECASVELIEVA